MERILVQTNINKNIKEQEYNAIFKDNKITYHDNDYIVVIDLLKRVINRKNNEYDIMIDLANEIIYIKLNGYENVFSKKIKLVKFLIDKNVHIKYHVIDDNYMVIYDVKFL